MTMCYLLTTDGEMMVQPTFIPPSSHNSDTTRHHCNIQTKITELEAALLQNQVKLYTILVKKLTISGECLPRNTFDDTNDCELICKS